jgi:hypothetical protein
MEEQTGTQHTMQSDLRTPNHGESAEADFSWMLH